MAWHKSRYASCLFAVEDERPVSGFDLHLVPQTSQRDIPNKKPHDPRGTVRLLSAIADGAQDQSITTT